MRHFARKVVACYVALMFMGKRYQEWVKNSFTTPDTAAVAFVSMLICMVVLPLMRIAGDHGYFSWLMSLPYRAYAYPIFFLVYFLNWRIWRIVRQPESKIGNESREMAEKLPVFSILIFLGVGVVMFVLLLSL